MVYALAPISDRSCFDALQYGQYDLLKTAGVVVFDISCESSNSKVLSFCTTYQRRSRR